ncbi:WS/DGAT domain-containing protein [Nocardia sp. NBC_01730]|uniref:WS/DGAT domain-containing protein n=1 Tax=Nocardia sp. NBC_01730 TaxID=2975998 RepID=UPI002E0F7F11|nr:WS/DGAT domain-containing protein [Nocardia sp. NBC_01730]
MKSAIAAATTYQHSIAGLATNVPDPKRLLSLHGSDVLEKLAYARIVMRLRTGIANLSYRDQLAFGIPATTTPQPTSR